MTKLFNRVINKTLSDVAILLSSNGAGMAHQRRVGVVLAVVALVSRSRCVVMPVRVGSGLRVWVLEWAVCVIGGERVVIG